MLTQLGREVEIRQTISEIWSRIGEELHDQSVDLLDRHIISDLKISTIAIAKDVLTQLSQVNSVEAVSTTLSSFTEDQCKALCGVVLRSGWIPQVPRTSYWSYAEDWLIDGVFGGSFITVSLVLRDTEILESNVMPWITDRLAFLRFLREAFRKGHIFFLPELADSESTGLEKRRPVGEATYGYRVLFYGALLRDFLKATGARFGIEECKVARTEPEYKHIVKKPGGEREMQLLLLDWRRRVREAITKDGELPRLWEFSDDNLPELPASTHEGLMVWLDTCLHLIADMQSDNGSVDGNELYLQRCQRDLRNSERAFEDLGIAVPEGFNVEPESIHHAEKQFKMLIRALTNEVANDGSSVPKVPLSSPPGNRTKTVNWLPPCSVKNLKEQTGLSQTTINTYIRTRRIPGGAVRENDDERGDVLLTPEGLEFLKRKGGKAN